MRYVLTVASLVCVIGWLVLSYVPGAQSALPTIAFTGAWSTAWLPALAGLTLGLFAAIQLWLVIATGQMVRHPAQADLRAHGASIWIAHLAGGLLDAVPLGHDSGSGPIPYQPTVNQGLVFVV